MARVRSALPDVLAAAAIGALVFAFFGHAFLNYDTFYALVWGDQAAHGHVPSYDVPVAPTPHPLAILAGAGASVFGDAGENVLLALGLLAFGALCVGLFRLGQTLWAWPVGLLAAAIFATRVPPLNFGVRGYVDLPAVALIVWAAVLEARRPRRGDAVLVLLALAGLLRPEAWLYAGAYWLWCAWPASPRERLRLLALAAIGPVAWVLSDLAVTGDPLWSFTGTTDLAAELHRRTGFDVVTVLPRRLGEIMRLPELIAAVLGFAAGLVWMRRRTVLPAAVAVLNGVAFLVLAAGGLPLLGRYLFLAGAMLSLFAAVAVLGWTGLAGGSPARARWRVGGVIPLLVILALAPAQLDRLSALRDDIAKRDRIQADLLDLVRSPAGTRALERCRGRALLVQTHRPVPLLAYWTGRSPRDIVPAQTGPGLRVLPRTPQVAALSLLDPNEPASAAAPIVSPPRGAPKNRSWFFEESC